MDIQNSTHLSHWLLSALMGLTIALHSGSLAASNFESGVFEFQQKLANNGNPQAQYKLAMMYENGRGVDKDINAAETWYKKSAANKYKPAQYRLTYLNVKGSGFGAQHTKWLNDLNNDARQGDAEALYLMGELYENGTGVKQNLQQSKKMYKAASTKGNIEAENRLYAVEQKMLRSESAQNEKQADDKKAQEAVKASEAAEQKRLAEIERKAQQAKAAQSRTSSQRQAQLQAEQQKLIAERKRIEAERRKLEAAQQKLRKAEVRANAKDNASKATGKEAAKEKTRENSRAAAEKEKFESDLCTGRAARFRTQCN